MRRAERRFHQASLFARVGHLLAKPGVSLLLSALVIGGAAGAGAVQGGQYAAFVASNGSLPDLIARNAGFGISAVVISSDNGMGEAEILAASGITSRNSLLFLNPVEIRERLKQVPLVREASVRKLFPDRLVIDIEERQPFGLWQRDGNVAIVSADGTAIDTMRDDRFADLPFVVGEGANLHIGEFKALLDAAGDLRPKIRAGIFVSGRRWNLKMTSGVEVRLPETSPGKALAALAILDHDARVLDKDVLWLDMRQPGRMIARMGADAAAARAEALAGKKRDKAGQT